MVAELSCLINSCFKKQNAVQIHHLSFNKTVLVIISVKLDISCWVWSIVSSYTIIFLRNCISHALHFPYNIFPINVIRSEVSGVMCFGCCIFRSMLTDQTWPEKTSRLVRLSRKQDKMTGDYARRHLLLLTTITTTPPPTTPTTTPILCNRDGGHLCLLVCLRVQGEPRLFSPLHLVYVPSLDYCMVGSLDLASGFSLCH